MHNEDTCDLLLPENQGPYNRTVKIILCIMFQLSKPVLWI